jgi:hypothetical protein
MRILDLPLKAKWYDMQESGEKPEEYREVTPYWCNRLLGECPFGADIYWKPVLDKTFEVIKENGERMPQTFNLNHLLVWQYGVRDYTHVCLRYGYTKRTFTHKIDSITIGRGNPAWGAPTDRDVFIIKHHKE